ncbi:unnamed protein product [Vicia faba]|uniref:Uncharacterized protein n=1 Tax=Vicia faba TaxID=3906 RepID=A0AAV1AMI5_VICFA|nr:unnamed protein product [Vicia faba]
MHEEEVEASETLKKKVKPSSTSTVAPTETDATTPNVTMATTQTNATVPTQPNDDTQQSDYIGDIVDDIISSIPDINTSQAPAEEVIVAKKKKKKKGKEVMPMRRRSSDGIKINWFKKAKPFTRPGSNQDQPMFLTDEKGGTLTREGSGSQYAKKKLRK